MGKTFGYIRVSSRDQNEARQQLAMQEFGVDAVYADRQSGRNFDRAGYQALLHRLQPGDTLVVKSIDRLGRNYEEILEQWRCITHDRQVAIVVLDMPLLDTRQGRDLTGTLIADIVLQLLSYVAQTEREFIRQRQAEGIAAARGRGVHMGRQPMPPAEGFEEQYALWCRGECSGRRAAAVLGVSPHTFLKWAQQRNRSCAD